MTSGRTPGTTRRGRLAFLIVAVIALGWGLHGRGPPVSAVYCADGVRPGGATTVMLSTTWCPYCAEARRFLQARSHPHCEFDTERSAQGAALYREYGGRGVPIIITRSGVLHGYDRHALEELLERSLYAAGD
jgi:glutaredoxin